MGQPRHGEVLSPCSGAEQANAVTDSPGRSLGTVSTGSRGGQGKKEPSDLPPRTSPWVPGQEGTKLYSPGGSRAWSQRGDRLPVLLPLREKVLLHKLMEESFPYYKTEHFFRKTFPECKTVLSSQTSSVPRRPNRKPPTTHQPAPTAPI